MAEKDSNALVVRAASGIQVTGEGSKGILSGMVADALALARHSGKELVAARLPLGGYEFCEPDYRQILLWAQALALEPEEVIRRLENASPDCIGQETLGFKVINGSIVTLNWNFEILPTGIFKWLDGLLIQEIRFEGSPADWLEMALENLPLLSRLEFSGVNLVEQYLPKMPGLTHLKYDICDLTGLGLWCAPGLTHLECFGMPIESVYLPVPGLTHFKCVGTHLSYLDLSSVPSLTHLECHANHITDLDLSPVPGLTHLGCSSNYDRYYDQHADLGPVPRLTTHLDLSPVQGLNHLDWAYNESQLTHLDLSPVPGLIHLECGGNQLTELDLSLVPDLTHLECQDNPLTKLEIRHLSKLIEFKADLTVTVHKRPDQKNTHV